MFEGLINPRVFLSLASLTLLTQLNAGCSDQGIHKLQGFAQGTSYHISYWSKSSVKPESVKYAVEAEFERIDFMLSNYRSDSDLEQFNQIRNNEVQEVGTEIVSLVRIASSVRMASHGCYDPTIKPLFELWKFNSDEPVIPTEEAIAINLRKIGLQALEVIDDSHLKKHIPDLQIDLSSIAQGYTVESISKVLEQKGIKNYLVEVGGELKTLGHKPDQQSWRIAIEKPLPGEQMLHKIITMPKSSPMAIMTSGTYRHYFDDHGKRYSHILDARTGRPIIHDLVSVTVALDNPVLADAWSTALLCLGLEDGLQAANQNAIPALFIKYQDNGLVETQSDALNALKSIQIQ